jgi:hypothetical protein
MAGGDPQTISMLTILLATCRTTRDTLRAAGNPVDAELLRDLERMISRTEVELANLARPA